MCRTNGRRARAKIMLRALAYAGTLEEAERLQRTFQSGCHGEGHSAAAHVLEQDWDRMVTFYRFPKDHWIHLRTTNVVESPFAALRLRTDAAKRFQKVENATAVIFKMLLLAKKRFRRLHAPELLQEEVSKASKTRFRKLISWLKYAIQIHGPLLGRLSLI